MVVACSQKKRVLDIVVSNNGQKNSVKLTLLYYRLTSKLNVNKLLINTTRKKIHEKPVNIQKKSLDR